MRIKLAAAALCSLSLGLAACGDDDPTGRTPIDTSSFNDAPQMVAHANASGGYRDDLANHRGCVPRTSYDGKTEPLVDNTNNVAKRPARSPADIPGYECAAVEWTQPNEDTSKPIVILVHGNSSSPASWEEYRNPAYVGNSYPTFSVANSIQILVEDTPREMLASKLIAARYRVYGFDARTDLILSASDPENSDNVSGNMDHGWGTPMLQSMIKAVIKANPGRKISLIGHSLGVSLIRDALRRLFVEYNAVVAGSVNPYASVEDLVFLSGANHGVVFGALGCADATGSTRSMTLYVNCELGDRDVYQPTYFYAPLNGVNDVFATPCADGDYAYGLTGACGGNSVQYTTVVMEDIGAGAYQDEFVTEASAALNSGASIDNHLISLSDYDRSGYFYDASPATFANHFGSARSDVGMNYILQKLAD